MKPFRPDLNLFLERRLLFIALFLRLQKDALQTAVFVNGVEKETAGWLFNDVTSTAEFI
jgi:hypothetical protein